MSNFSFVFDNGLDLLKRVRHKVFLSYQHSLDQHYYDAFSRAFHDTYESIYDNSLERRIDSDDVDYVMRRIRENYITGTSCTLVLVGKQTWGRKYIDWEVKATLEKEHGLIGVQLPSAALNDEGKVHAPSRLADNIKSKYALWVTWADITSSQARLDECIAEAKSRSKTLIDNSRSRLLRNA